MSAPLRTVAWIGIFAAACLIVLFFVDPGAPAPAGSPPPGGDGFTVTTVYLVRHAEKAAEPVGDPPLLESGTARATNLAVILREAGIKAIYTSQYLRTKQTAAPLAARLGIASTVVPLSTDPMKAGEVSRSSLAELAAQVIERAGEAALIVGHSNTVPETIRALGGGGDAVAPIGSKDFDDLYVVTIYAKGKASVAHLKY